MTRMTWSAAIAAEQARLAALARLPDALSTHTVLQVMAFMTTLAAALIKVQLLPHSIRPRITTPNLRGEIPLVRDTLDRFALEIVQRVLRSGRSEVSLPATLDAAGFAGFIAAT